MRIVDPAAYLIQKMIVLPERGAHRSKDLLYVFDTFTVFADSLDQLRPQAQSIVRELSNRRRNTLGRSIEQYCGTMTDATRGAARIAATQRMRPPTAGQLLDACGDAWSKLLD